MVFDPDCTATSRPRGRCASATTNGVLWTRPSQDTSSAVTGSTTFDFEGDGRVEAVYADECFLRVYDGLSGDVLYSAAARVVHVAREPDRRRRRRGFSRRDRHGIEPLVRHDRRGSPVRRGSGRATRTRCSSRGCAAQTDAECGFELAASRGFCRCAADSAVLPRERPPRATEASRRERGCGRRRGAHHRVGERVHLRLRGRDARARATPAARRGERGVRGHPRVQRT
jgi:hypothetical protein